MTEQEMCVHQLFLQGKRSPKPYYAHAKDGTLWIDSDFVGSPLEVMMVCGWDGASICRVGKKMLIPIDYAKREWPHLAEDLEKFAKRLRTEYQLEWPCVPEKEQHGG